jgi:hypothetical protein
MGLEVTSNAMYELRTANCRVTVAPGVTAAKGREMVKAESAVAAATAAVRAAVASADCPLVVPTDHEAAKGPPAPTTSAVTTMG